MTLRKRINRPWQLTAGGYSIQNHLGKSTVNIEQLDTTNVVWMSEIFPKVLVDYCTLYAINLPITRMNMKNLNYRKLFKNME